MPQGARTPGNRRIAAFTLVEILVTLAVIAIGLALVVLTQGHDAAADLRRESDRLASSLEYAAELAQWRRADIAWHADGSQYRFLQPAADGRWIDDTDAVLAPHALAPGVQLRVLGAAGTPIPAAVTLRASGRNDPFSVVLETSSSSRTVAADPLNRVRVLDSGR